MAAAMTDADSLRCLDERIRAVSKALKRKICAAEAESVATQHATLLTYIWSGYDMGAAASFLRGKRSPERTTEELEDEVTAFFLTTPSQELGTMSMEPSGPNAAHAARHVVEWRLFLWLREQNCKHGVAPSRLQLVRHALLQVPEGLPAELEERVRRPLGGAARAQRKWLRRFRRGWAAKLGQLPIAPPVPVHQLQEKALAFFRWANGAQALADKPVLIINMDEASLSLRLTGNKGTILRKQPLACDRASLSERRSACTCMASVCTDPAVNERLPQVLVGNAHQFTKAVLAAKSELGEKLLLWKEQSAWVNRFVMVRYIKKLCERLGSDLTDRCVFLLVDMASPHIHADVFRMARKKGLRMLLVPAGLTPWLQPLDSHVFRQFRAKLQELWLSCKSAAQDGEVSACAWLQLVNEAVQQVVVGRNWAYAFRRAGVLG
ncbi:unnamed protein product [Effrenium voratum]|nr:unnamed protein product [Effrenium voratum]